MEENFKKERLTQFSYASRKEPEFMCHRLVRCTACDLVYVTQPPSNDDLARAYHSAAYDSSTEADDAAAAYIQAIAPTLIKLKARQSALEIGTGNGAFLELLIQSGFQNVVGVEPSAAAISSSPATRRDWIHHGTFVESDFSHDSFDLICCFMTMEHVADPRVVASAALRLLRPGGAFVVIAHDYRSKVNRLLGKYSPIIDIEHMQLFSKASIFSLFENCGFTATTVSSFANTYSIEYWLRLLPLPSKLKDIILRTSKFAHVNNMKASINVGNMLAAGFKPLQAAIHPMAMDSSE